MPTATAVDQEKTGLGNYFIANYPPFSYWKPQHLAAAQTALDSAPAEKSTEVGSYFVANYPPFSTWSPEQRPAILSALDRAPARRDTG